VRREMFVLALAVVLSSLCVVFFGELSKGAKEDGMLRKTQHAHASYVRSYADFRSLMEDRPVVIVGEVVSSEFVLSRTFGPGVAHHKVKVLEVVQDERQLIQRGDIITVSQFGGFTTLPNGSVLTYPDGTRIVYDMWEDPLMKKGERSLLFLNGPSTQPAFSDKEVYLGTSPQTRFPVLDGCVRWLGELYPERNMEIFVPEELRKISGMRLGETVGFLKEIRKEIGKE